jgi:hypothetical protein
MGYTVTTSSELMENYIQADILVPQDTFIALQTSAGASLLFSVGTGNILNLTMEVPGQPNGWQLVDLSSAQAKQDFPGGATCRTFGAAQAVNLQAGKSTQIHLAMVLNDGTNDHLYVSLNNSDSDLSWTSHPVWTPCPYNALDANNKIIPAPSPLQITGVFLSEATDAEYIVADIIRNPTEPVGVISRFYLDVSTPTDPMWKPHDVSGDIQSAGYASCLGRAADAYGVDGIYTKGAIATAAQLLYIPVFNAFNPSMPAPSSRLNLSGGLVADAIAACRNADNTSDLYVASQGGLYYFASSNQKDGAVGELILKTALLTGVRDLYAYAADGNVTVWGLNGSDQVFYVTCPQGSITTSNAWSVPLAIMTGVDAVSPYIDRAYSANTFFAHGPNGLIKAVKTPGTGLWTQRNITLAPSDVRQAATTISSYTTHIKVTDDNGTPAANVPVSVTASNVISVYVNHLYYVAGPTPIQLTTDTFGTVTIVETTQSLAGTRFNAVVDRQNVPEINPMDAAFQRNSKYDSVSSLQNAQIVNRDGTTRPFIPTGTPPDDFKKVAYSNQCLAKAYSGLSGSPAPRFARPMALRAVATPAGFAAAGISDGILVDLGDLFNWLASGVEAAISVIEDTAEKVWHFVANIAGQVYHGILDCVELVVAAATWVYHAIEIAIEDIIQFLEFLFGWQDILVTHRVLKNVLIQFSKYVIDGIEGTKTQVATVLSQIQSQINSWADIPDFNQTPSQANNSNPPLAGQDSAPANLGIHHFKGNCASSSGDVPVVTPGEAIFQDLINLMSDEATTLTNAFDAIKTQIIDPFNSLSVTDIIRRFLAIIADTILQSVENVFTTMLDVVAQLIAGVMDILTAKLDIPVLSWLYNELTGDDLSFLDLGCLIAAIPVTLIYKATAKIAPFPSGDDFTNGLLNATSFAQIQAQFLVTPPHMLTEGAVRERGVMTAQDDPVLDQAKLKVFGIVAGVGALVGSVVCIVVVNLQRVLDVFDVSSKALATIGCIGNILYVSPNIATLINAKTDNWYSQTNNVVTGISILKGMVAIPAAAISNKGVTIAFASVESFINVVWNVPVIANIIVNKDVWNTTYTSLIPESIGNFAFNFGGIMELPITLVSDLKAKAIMAAVQAGLMLGYGVFMVIAGGIYEWVPGQQH